LPAVSLAAGLDGSGGPAGGARGFNTGSKAAEALPSVSAGWQAPSRSKARRLLPEAKD